MHDDPGLDVRALADALQTAWAVEARRFTFVPGYDMRAASYAVTTADRPIFMKVRFGPAPATPLEVPLALLEAGVPNILAPIRTRSSGLWHALSDDSTLVVYPFVSGRNASRTEMHVDQWRSFGSTLRAVHDSVVAERFIDRLPAETFELPAKAMVHRVLDLATRPSARSRGPSRERMGAFLRDRAGLIDAMLVRAEALGTLLRGRPFGHVLCHADIHAANVLVADDGRIYLVDWDGPMLAPRERDLLFVIGSRIARDVQPHEEVWFFEGYGNVPVDPDAIVYYRYERILEDIGEFGTSVLGDGDQSEASHEADVAMAERLFEPGGIVESVEHV